MKIFRLLFMLICCASFTGVEPQHFFYMLEEDSDEYYDWVMNNNHYCNLDELFKNPGKNRCYIDPEVLDSADKYDFSKLLNLESVTILLATDPYAPDSEKKAYVQKVKEELGKSSCFSKCPKLKQVIFIVCNHIYLSNAQCRSRIWEMRYGKRYWKRTVHSNLQAAWDSFGNMVQENLPGIKLYATTVDW